VEPGKTRIFQGLPEPARREILAAAFTKTLSPRETLASEGEPATTFYLVVVGHLKLVRTAQDGREVIVRFIAPGDPYAGVVLLDRPIYPVSAIAVEPTRMLGWPKPVIGDLAARHPQLRINVLEEITRHMTDALDRVSELTTERVPQRVARTLLRLAEHDGHAEGEAITIAHPVTRQELADLAGTTLFTVSRLLSAWETRGFVATARGHVTVLKPAAISTLAESPEEDAGTFSA
jgi:CRP-like cAMP-binding protein